MNVHLSPSTFPKRHRFISGRRSTLAPRLLMTCVVLLIFSCMIQMVLTNWFAASSVQAAANRENRQSATPRINQSSDPQHVTIIVLDMSGSMAQNDRDGLRCSAANAYISLSGVGDFIGVIGLDNNDGSRGGLHNFERAQSWVQPTEMVTQSARQSLISTIASKSNNCRPDASTPTYDALAKAFSMLQTATIGNGRSGSVILLTDGVPAPDTNAQLSAISQDLINKFKSSDFPIDTIALGTDQSTHPFLNALANATGGHSYDDSNGVVQGTADALNIAPFFVQIFAIRNNRTVGATVAPVSIAGSTSRDLPVANYASHLDVIVVKDQPNIQVTLTAPGSSGQTLPPVVAGTFIATDPHYAIFSIDGTTSGVESGIWRVNVSGSGRFLVDSLIVSSLQLAIVQPTAHTHVLPLGQDFIIAATISSNGASIIGNVFTITGTIQYAGEAVGTIPSPRDLALSDKASPGIYQVEVNIPETAPAGSYDIAIAATQISDTHLAEAHVSIRLELFPVPFFLAGKPLVPVNGTVNATATQWDPFMQTIYSLPVVSWFAGLPLDGLAAHSSADIAGEVVAHGQLYSHATVTGIAQQSGTTHQVAVQVVDDGGGHFHVIFPTPVSGDYSVTFQTAGAFIDTNGDLGTTTRTVHLTVYPATMTQELRAWLITLLLYPVIILFLYNIFVRRPLIGRPVGSWERQPVDVDMYETAARGTFRQSRIRGFWQWFAYPNHQTSQQAFGDIGGVVFRFRRSSGIELRGSWPAARQWRLEENKPLPRRFRPCSEILQNQSYIYTITQGRSTGPSGSNTIWDNQASGRSRRGCLAALLPRTGASNSSTSENSGGSWLD